jgi:excisionase family DNA binding protein
MKPSKINRRMYKAGEASRVLGISVRYLHDLRAAGRIPFHRVGPRTVLFSEADLEQFLSDTRIGGIDHE